MHYNIFARGALAQLGERQVRNLQARGSIPLCSTITGTGGNVTAAPFRLFYLFILFHSDEASFFLLYLMLTADCYWYLILT